ncbi:MAG TPA: DegQ family serine endoprotease [Paenalcaligenes sp.]|nr:DegQ family serine endoprotease [Paenalcaligenes sp.]
MQHSMRQIKDNNRPWVHFWALLLLSLGLLCSNNLAAQGRIENLPDFTQIVEETESSVVNIRTTESVPVRSGHGFDGDPYDFFRWFFGPDAAPDRGPQQPHQEPEEQIVPRGVGSGFVISDDGYILTNNHVVADAQDIYVTFVDGEEYSAEVVGTDERTDVALIKIDAKDLQPLPIGDSKELKKGEWVLAIGSPFGLDATVTVGVVSAINRDTGDYLPFIQTDVAVNPGNSGGPLLNTQGEVVGVNAQIVSRSGGFMGISLAIPIDEAMDIVDQLKEHGKVTRGRIGVQITNVDDEVAKAIGLDSHKGALVSHIEEDGPAAKAGVRSGDVILEFDGKEVKQMSDLPRIVGATQPGTKAKMKVWRKGKSETLKVTVDELKTGDTQGKAPTAPQEQSSDRLGLTVAALDDDDKRRLGIDEGVVVESASGPAARVGLSSGDIILRINDEDINTAKDYAKVVDKLPADKQAAILVMRGGNAQWVLITPSE